MVPEQQADNGTSVAAEKASTEELLRASLYALLARVLRATPDKEALDELSQLDGDKTELGRALAALGDAAIDASPAAVDDEYHALFMGVGGSELQPYGSYYLTGFLYEKPLAKLRDEMLELGIAQADDVSEPEDHIAALCEMMCGMIMGAFGEPVSITRQRAFFDEHIGPWAARFFADLEAAESTDFYESVGAIGRLFMELESRSFEIAA